MSSDKAFGANDLKPNKSHLIPGKSPDGTMADPLQTAKHSREEVDALIQEGREARGEAAPLPKDLGDRIVNVPEDCTVTVVKEAPPIVLSNDFIRGLLKDEDFNGRLMDIEKKLEELEERLVKVFKHAGFNF